MGSDNIRKLIKQSLNYVNLVALIGLLGFIGSDSNGPGSTPKISVRAFSQYIVDEFTEFDDIKLAVKKFDPRISSVKGQCATHYTMEPGLIASIFKWVLVYASFLL